MSVLRSVENSPRCFGCGKENEAGLRLEFEILEDGRLETRFAPREIHGGWEGVFHGGLMATLLDEAMLAYLHLVGTDAATAELEVRYKEAVRIGDNLRVHAWEVGRRGRLIEMAAEARRDETGERNGRLVAHAKARCIIVAREGDAK